MIRIDPIEQYCVNCQLCVVACRTAHSRSQDAVAAHREGVASRITVEIEYPRSMAVACRHCADACCVTACLSGSLSRDGDGLVTNDRDRCVGCFSCVAACPYGAMVPDGDAAVNCDLCRHRPAGPACVEACPNGALIAGPRS